MDEHGLPIVGKGVDYTRVNALEPKRIMFILNKFIINTVDFLNKFAATAEEKLQQLSFRMQQLEITLNLLDAQLHSIGNGELDAVQATSTYTMPTDLAAAGTKTPAALSGPNQPAPRAPEEKHEGVPPPPPGAEGPPPPPEAEAEAEGPPPPPPETAKEEEVLKVKDDPRYKDFFRKFRIGANPLQLAMEMRNKGLNPDYLETPDAPAPRDGGSGPPPAAPMMHSFAGDSDSESSESTASGFSSDSD